MNTYTEHPTWVNELIQKDLDTIVSIIRKKLNPLSIILVGGFGKGEGMVSITGKKVTPLNDYDLYVIGKQRHISDHKLYTLGVECAKAIGRGGLDYVEHPDQEYDIHKYFHVDLRWLCINNLHTMLPTQRTYDIKHGSITLFGEDYTHKINDVRVPPPEGIRILFNKMDHLLLSKKKKSKEIRLIYIMKTYQDLAAALLTGTPHVKARNRERYHAIKTLDFPARLKQKIKWSLDFRTQPHFTDYTEKEILQEWNEAKEWIFYALTYLLRTHYKIHTTNPSTIAAFIAHHLPRAYFTPYLNHTFGKFGKHLTFLQYYLNLRYCMVCWNKHHFIWKPLLQRHDVGLTLAAALFLYLYGTPEESAHYLTRVKGRIKNLEQDLLTYYGLYYLQKII